MKYTYKVKIITSDKNKENISRHLNHFHSKFHSVTALRVQLIDEFKDQVPACADFDVGYFDGNQTSKVLLATEDDMNIMYQRNFPNGGLVNLWCDARVSGGTKRKRDDGYSVEQHQRDREAEYYKQLNDRYKTEYTTPQYRMWSKMLVSGLHDKGLDEPPDVVGFDDVTVTPKRPRKESLSNSLTNAAVAIVNTLSATDKPKSDPVPKPIGVSPGKSVELQMKNYEQLRYLQQLYDDHVIDKREFKEQKETILLSLRKL